MMRWFTDAAYSADKTDWDETLWHYYAHIEKIAASLPTDLVALATEPRFNLHDSEVREVLIDGDKITTVATAGDLQLGYRELTMQFEGAAIVPENLQALAFAIGARYETERWGTIVTTIRAQEVDVLSDGHFVLRLKLWPFYEFAIEFSGFTLSEKLSSGRTRSPGVFRHIRPPQS